MSDNDDDNRPHRKPIFEEKYQTRSAPQKVVATKEDVYEFFKSYGTITVSGKFKVLHELDNGEIEFMDKKSFIDKFQPYRIDITSAADEKTKKVPFTELWLNWLDQRAYDGIIFDPSKDYHYGGKYNLFKGYKVAAREGDCSIFLDYMKDIICSGNQRDYEFLIALVAQMFLKPHLKPGIAVVLRGDEGVGKSFFIEKLSALMSPYHFKTSNPAYVFGDHNAQLKNVILLHLEEAVWAGSKRDESLLKDLITGPTIPINDKYVPVYLVPNHLHLFISGNPDWLVSAGFRARRIFALHVSDAQRTITDYFARIDKWFTSGGCAYLMHYFLNYKSDINLRLVPVTDELLYQKKQSLSGIAEWAMSIGETGEMPYGEIQERDGVITGVVVIKRLLYHDFLQSPMGKNSKISEVKFGMEFTKLFPVAQSVSDDSVIKNDLKCKGMRGIRFNAYWIPNIDVYREAFDLRLSGKTEWSEAKEWTVLRPNTTEIEDIYGKKPY
jgi:hypothetical protein